VGKATPAFLTAPKLDMLDEATRTHGSNPARNTRFQIDCPRRAEILALPGHLAYLPQPTTRRRWRAGQLPFKL